MTTLLIPAAGQSSRFPGMRPKWLLTMPDGMLMFEKSLALLNLDQFQRIIIICLKDHIDNYINLYHLQTILSRWHSNFEVCMLDELTKSQAETISLALLKCHVSGAFFAKDCDNQFDVTWEGGNEVSVVDLGCLDEPVIAGNKSYVSIDHLSIVTNIVEKQVISNFFCCGGFGFSSAEEFIRHFQLMRLESEVYISHVVFSMLISGTNFRAITATKYVDWGTLSDYRKYVDSFCTVFCDVDGVLVLNGSRFGKSGWDTLPLIENINVLLKIQRQQRLYLVITSARPESELPKLKLILNEFGLKVDKFIMGLPHSKRYLINDYSATNKYPTALSINIERDTETLKHFMS